MFSTFEKQLFLAIGLVAFVVFLGAFGIVRYSLVQTNIQSTLQQASNDTPSNPNQEEQQMQQSEEMGQQQEETPVMQEESVWNRYTNEAQGFTFEYPKLYDEDPAFASCQVKQENPTSFAMGQIGINVLAANQQSLSDFVDAFVAKRTAAPYDWNIESRQQSQTGEADSIGITYRFGGTGRYAEAVFAKYGEKIFVLSFAAGNFTCNETDAYAHLLSTFQPADAAN